MKYDLAIIGFGVIGVESLYSIAEKINKNKKFKIAVIERNIKNIPGGVAYSKLSSKFGFFIKILFYWPKSGFLVKFHFFVKISIFG